MAQTHLPLSARKAKTFTKNFPDREEFREMAAVRFFRDYRLDKV
jgi:hypothetical protein